MSRRGIFDSLARNYLSYYEGEWSAPPDQLALQNFDQWDDGTNDASSYLLGKKGFQVGNIPNKSDILGYSRGSLEGFPNGQGSFQLARHQH